MPVDSIARVARLLCIWCAVPLATLAQSSGVAAGPDALRPGDRIVLTVSGEAALSDTFTVAAGPAVTLPLVGEVSLVGVGRDSLQAHLHAALARVIRAPIITTQVLVRLAVFGEVARPGFVSVPADALLSDAITLAGGVTGNAEMRRLVLTRQGVTLQRDAALSRSIAEGRTIGDLGITAGDELMVPRRHDGERTARIIGLLVGIPVAVFVLTRM